MAAAPPQQQAGTAPQRPDTEFFKGLKYDDPEHPLPWDIGRVNDAIKSKAHLFRGCVIDCGCGSGDNSRWIATLPKAEAVMAIDASEYAVAEARRRQADAERSVKPHEKLLPVSYIEADALDLSGCKQLPPPGHFDVLCDSALFHCFGSDELERRYLQQVRLQHLTSYWIAAPLCKISSQD